MEELYFMAYMLEVWLLIVVTLGLNCLVMYVEHVNKMVHGVEQFQCVNVSNTKFKCNLEH